MKNGYTPPLSGLGTVSGRGATIEDAAKQRDACGYWLNPHDDIDDQIIVEMMRAWIKCPLAHWINVEYISLKKGLLPSPKVLVGNFGTLPPFWLSFTSDKVKQPCVFVVVHILVAYISSYPITASSCSWLNHITVPVVWYYQPTHPLLRSHPVPGRRRLGFRSSRKGRRPSA